MGDNPTPLYQSKTSQYTVSTKIDTTFVAHFTYHNLVQYWEEEQIFSHLLLLSWQFTMHCYNSLLLGVLGVTEKIWGGGGGLRCTTTCPPLLHSIQKYPKYLDLSWCIHNNTSKCVKQLLITMSHAPWKKRKKKQPKAANGRPKCMQKVAHPHKISCWLCQSYLHKGLYAGQCHMTLTLPTLILLNIWKLQVCHSLSCAICVVHGNSSQLGSR